MHISSTAPAIPAQQSSPGKSNAVPPGLANRNLSLPPGIAKKLAAGGIPPAGIAKRFPAAIETPSPETGGSDTGSAAPITDGSSQDSTQSVDLLV
jgi:hypothetical protein